MTQFKVWIWRITLIPLFFVVLASTLVKMVLHPIDVLLQVFDNILFRYECVMKSCPKGSFMNDPRLQTVGEFFKETWSGQSSNSYERYVKYQENQKTINNVK